MNPPGVHLVLETTGAWGGRANHLIQRLIILHALRNKCNKSEAAVICRGRLCVSLFQSIGRQLERGFGDPGTVLEGAGNLRGI